MKQEGLALAMYELYSIMRDSISNEELRRLNLGKQYQYEFDKRTTADSVKAVEQQKVMAARISKEKTQRFAVTGVLILTVVFSGFIFNRWRIIKKQKLQIQQQHTALGEEKKKSDDSPSKILKVWLDYGLEDTYEFVITSELELKDTSSEVDIPVFNGSVSSTNKFDKILCCP